MATWKTASFKPGASAPWRSTSSCLTPAAAITSRGSITAPCFPRWVSRAPPTEALLEWWFGGGGKAIRGRPRSTAAMPAALPMCDARWSAVMEERGRAERVR